MKLFKKIVVSFLFLMTSIAPISVYASESLENNLEERKIVTCEASPSKWHEVKSRGLGILYKGAANSSAKLVFNNGCTWQCKYCKHVIVTKGEAARGQAIGNYATWSPGYQLSQNGTVLYSNNIYYTSSSKLEGYIFSYN